MSHEMSRRTNSSTSPYSTSPEGSLSPLGPVPVILRMDDAVRSIDRTVPLRGKAFAYPPDVVGFFSLDLLCEEESDEYFWEEEQFDACERYLKYLANTLPGYSNEATGYIMCPSTLPPLAAEMIDSAVRARWLRAAGRGTSSQLLNDVLTPWTVRGSGFRSHVVLFAIPTDALIEKIDQMRRAGHTVDCAGRPPEPYYPLQITSIDTYRPLSVIFEACPIVPKVQPDVVPMPGLFTEPLRYPNDCLIRHNNNNPESPIHFEFLRVNYPEIFNQLASCLPFAFIHLESTSHRFTVENLEAALGPSAELPNMNIMALIDAAQEAGLVNKLGPAAKPIRIMALDALQVLLPRSVRLDGIKAMHKLAYAGKIDWENDY